MRGRLFRSRLVHGFTVFCHVVRLFTSTRVPSSGDINIINSNLLLPCNTLNVENINFKIKDEKTILTELDQKTRNASLSLFNLLDCVAPNEWLGPKWNKLGQRSKPSSFLCSKGDLKICIMEKRYRLCTVSFVHCYRFLIGWFLIGWKSYSPGKRLFCVIQYKVLF